MNLFKIGQLQIVRNAPDGNPGGGGGEGGDGAAHPVTAPWAEADGVWSLGEGETAQPWHATIPEPEARAHIEAKGYKNPAELALANFNLTKLQRGDPTVIGLPGEDATPEQMSEFYGRLGRPEAPDGYEFQFGDDVKVDDGMLTFARGAFHEAGLTPKQAQIVADKWNEFAAEQTQGLTSQITEANQQEIAALTAKWGADLEKNQAAGQRVVKALGLDASLIERVEDSIGSAAVVELLATIGRKSDEGGFLTNSNNNSDPNDPTNMTREQANARIAQLQADAAFQAKYTDAKNPGHKEAVDLMQRLFARA